ncbi:MAG: PAS domain-containing sensor histidine kinase [Clostridia bacterium]|nr:PAS domain-containing sensor histidine kinase [Clostridia bacterium]
MKRTTSIVKNSLITLAILCLCFLLCLVLKYIFNNSALISAVFVLGVYLISVVTEGYIYGITSALLCVLAVNFAFDFPFYAFNFTIAENIVSAIILLIVTMITCALTAKVKHHEALKAERDMERMRANLLRAVSHDLRTPLTTIYSSSSALLENYDEFSDDQQKEMIKGISEDSKWLYRMVENLLSITKLDGGNVKIIKTETVLDELLDSVLVKFSKRYPNQTIDVDIPEEFILIPMDALLIEQVLINILENSVQHAEGMTQLKLKVFTISNKAIFEIMDNGCGIPDAKLKNIFSGIYTSYSEISDRRKNNAGIGLSVCASIIKAHGGDIKASNLKDGGCVFRFNLNMEDR